MLQASDEDVQVALPCFLCCQVTTGSFKYSGMRIWKVYTSCYLSGWYSSQMQPVDTADVFQMGFNKTFPSHTSTRSFSDIFFLLPNIFIHFSYLHHLRLQKEMLGSRSVPTFGASLQRRVARRQDLCVRSQILSRNDTICFGSFWIFNLDMLDMI